MRRIYASPRMENIERVVALMAEHGIATKVTNRRVYERSSYSRFSYARPGSSESWPAVWITRANDHTRARMIMREIGIEPATRFADELAAARNPPAAGRNRHLRIAMRVRLLVLVAVVVAIMVYTVALFFGHG